MRADRDRGPRLAFFGAMTLLAREIRRHLESLGYPSSGVSLYDSSEGEGAVTEFNGEALVVTRPDESVVGESDLAFVCCAGDPRAPEYLDLALKGGGAVVDLAGVTLGRGDVPVVNHDVNPDSIRAGGRIIAAPNPPAHTLSTLLHRVRQSFPLRAATATVFRPVSEFGDRGVEELHQQTVSLLSFASIPTEVLGRQAAFNLFPVALQPGPDASLDEVTREQVLRVLDAPELPLAVRIVQVPVFHGHGFSLHVEVDGAHGVEDLAGALEQKDIVSISRGDDGRTQAELADEAGIWVGSLSKSSPDGGRFWIWAVSDAIRSGTALNAARLAMRWTEIAA
jgi:aspartate-semialdehyde dehydrogenase